MENLSLLIGGADVPATGGATFDRLNPLTGEVATRAAAATPADARAAADAAAAAFPVWSALSPTARRAKLTKAAELMEANAARVAAIMVQETGCTHGWGHFNIHLAVNMLREAAALTTQISGEVIPSDVPGALSMAIRQPAGVCLGIAPWNAPIILGVRSVAVPLACGNTVVMKASEVCPATHRFIGEMLAAAGLGDGVVNIVTSSAADNAAVVEALIAHPAVKRINFTGSTRVGKLLAVQAAQHLKPILLELGGKAPLLVLDDADLDAAVDATVFGAYANQGQICMSTERVIAHESVADAFAAKLAARVKALPVGDPRTGEFVLASVVGQPTVDRINRLLADATAKGAKVIAGGTATSTIIPGIVVDHVTPEMELWREETFAPQVSITRVMSDDEAIAKANDTEYGLSAAVFTRDISRGLAVARRIESGICHINSPTVQDEAQMPFGGVKGSGYGRFGGKAGVAEFTELRWISIQTTPRRYPF